MTITAAYAPEELATNTAQEYRFTFPAVDDASVEVYEIIDVDGTEYQYLVPIQDYTLVWNIRNVREPLRRGGKITFSRLHSVGTQRIRIARNTLIDQTYDLPPFSPFNGRMVEFALDKHTMICQELADRKCTVTTSTPITQLIVFTAYDDFKASVVNFAVQKIYDILEEIDNSAEDCSEELERT